LLFCVKIIQRSSMNKVMWILMYEDSLGIVLRSEFGRHGIMWEVKTHG
jgi:hypothetical protein